MRDEHIRCRCGGIIVDREGDGIYRCDKCGHTYALWKLDYDYLDVNPYTGWKFPMKEKDWPVDRY